MITNLSLIRNARHVLAILVIGWLGAATPLAAQSFVVDLRSTVDPPVCDGVLGFDTSGDCLHGLSSSLGTALECLTDPSIPPATCPALSFATPSDKVFSAHTSAMGEVDFDPADPDSCPNHCTTGCPSGPYCQAHCCTSLPGDEEDGLDAEYAGGQPSGEDIRLYVGRPTLISDVLLWRGALAEFSFARTACPGIQVSYREGTLAANTGDGFFTFPGGGYYLASNEAIVWRNPELFPSGTDRLGIATFRLTVVDPRDIPHWQRSCPAFISVFDRGFLDNASTSSFYWQRIDDAFNGSVRWTATTGVSTDNCGLPNFTGGAALAACFQSAGNTGGYDTSLISRDIDLTGVDNPVMRFMVNFRRHDDELLDVMASTDQGASWTLLRSLATSLGASYAVGGEEVVIDLGGYAGETGLRLRFRLWDPVGAAGDHDDYAQIDDIVIYDDAPLFEDGFESGDTTCWPTASPPRQWPRCQGRLARRVRASRLWFSVVSSAIAHSTIQRIGRCSTRPTPARRDGPPTGRFRHWRGAVVGARGISHAGSSSTRGRLRYRWELCSRRAGTSGACRSPPGSS